MVGEVRQGGRCRLRTCPPGTFVSRFGFCDFCQPGSQFDRSRRRCVQCPRNTVNEGRNFSRCRRCPPGLQPGFDQRECVCPDGNELVNGRCRRCRPGSFSDLDRNELIRGKKCVPCSPLQFSNTPGATLCDSCGPNAISTTFGATTCTPCPEGTTAMLDVNNMLGCNPTDPFSFGK